MEAAGRAEWTMERIAMALDVGYSSIQRDLGDLPAAGKLKPAKTASNPKGAGRQGHQERAKKTRERPILAKAQGVVRALLEAGQPVSFLGRSGLGGRAALPTLNENSTNIGMKQGDARRFGRAPGKDPRVINHCATASIIARATASKTIPHHQSWQGARRIASGTSRHLPFRQQARRA